MAAKANSPVVSLSSASTFRRPGPATVTSSAGTVLFWAAAALVAWIAVVPIGMLVWSSLAAGENRLPFEQAGLTLENYLSVLTNFGTYVSLWHTAVFAGGATALGVSIAVLFAWLIERTDIWCRRVLFIAILIPMAIPNMIYAMSWVQLLGPNNGLITRWLGDAGLGALSFSPFSLWGMVFVQGIALASHAYLLVAAPFRMLDPSWEEQSLISGKGLFTTLRRVTLPVLKPALLAAVTFFGIVSMETFDVPVTLGITSRIDVLSTRIYWASHPEGGGLPNYGAASALAMLLLLIAFLFIRLYQHQIRNAKQFVTVTGKGFRPRRMPLGRWRLPLFALAVAVILVAVALPLFSLLWRSLLTFYMPPSERAFALLNLNAYRALLTDADLGQVLANTAIVAVTAGTVTVALAMVVAWLIVRGPVPQPWRKNLNTLAFLPQAVPSIVIGLSLMLLYLWLPIPIYGTVWIIALAMVTKYLAYSAGTMLAAQMQVAGELEEASRISGAKSLRTYRRIVLPLIGPAVFGCIVWVVIHVVRELGLALMLYSLGSQVLSTKIWLLWEGGAVAKACAIGVLTVIFLTLLLSLPWVFQNVRLMLRYIRNLRAGQPSISAVID